MRFGALSQFTVVIESAWLLLIAVPHVTTGVARGVWNKHVDAVLESRKAKCCLFHANRDGHDPFRTCVGISPVRYPALLQTLPSAYTETLQPTFMKYLRPCLGPRYLRLPSGDCSLWCYPRHVLRIRSESPDFETAAALNNIYRAPGQHATILFYDRVCLRRRRLEAHPDLAWASTINNVRRSMRVDISCIYNNEEGDV